MLERDEGFARCERVPEDADDLVGVGLVPSVNDLVEVAAEQTTGDVAEYRLRDWVDFSKSEIGVHEIDAELRLIRSV